MQPVNPGMTKAISLELAEHHARQFNEKHPVGSTVWYRMFGTFGPVNELKTVSQAVPVEHAEHWAVEVELEAVGRVLLFRVLEVDETKRCELNFVPPNYKPAHIVTHADRDIRRALDELFMWWRVCLPGHGLREHLRAAQGYLREAILKLEEAYQELGS